MTDKPLSFFFSIKVNSKFVRVHIMKAYKWNGGLAPLILKFCTRWSWVVSLMTQFFNLGEWPLCCPLKMRLCGLQKESGFLVQRKFLYLCRSLNSGHSSPQLSRSHHSVLFLCCRNILHDSHCRSGNWLRSGRAALADLHRLPDCRSDRVSGNPVVPNILIAQLLNPLAPELFFLILAHSVYKMWIIQEPNKLALWNKLHFEEKNTESIEHV